MSKMKFIALVMVAMAGCKQGLGERCQINDDCVSPYVCNQAKMQCQETTTGGIDATVTDAPKTSDAPFVIIDAATDAPAPDAPLFDAAVD